MRSFSNEEYAPLFRLAPGVHCAWLLLCLRKPVVDTFPVRLQNDKFVYSDIKTHHSLFKGKLMSVNQKLLHYLNLRLNLKNLNKNLKHTRFKK